MDRRPPPGVGRRPGRPLRDRLGAEGLSADERDEIEPASSRRLAHTAGRPGVARRRPPRRGRPPEHAWFALRAMAQSRLQGRPADVDRRPDAGARRATTPGWSGRPSRRPVPGPAVEERAGANLDAGASLRSPRTPEAPADVRWRRWPPCPAGRERVGPDLFAFLLDPNRAGVARRPRDSPPRRAARRRAWTPSNWLALADALGPPGRWRWIGCWRPSGGADDEQVGLRARRGPGGVARPFGPADRSAVRAAPGEVQRPRCRRQAEALYQRRWTPRRPSRQAKLEELLARAGRRRRPPRPGGLQQHEGGLRRPATRSATSAARSAPT